MGQSSKKEKITSINSCIICKNIFLNNLEISELIKNNLE